jgi:hypothetical protein
MSLMLLDKCGQHGIVDLRLALFCRVLQARNMLGSAW